MMTYQRSFAQLILAFFACVSCGHLEKTLAQEALDSNRSPNAGQPNESSTESPESATKPKPSLPATENFMRIRKDSKGRPVAMETSITRYESTNKSGDRVTVDLIGAVHIGESEYYQALNEQFKQYEGLLFELVAPKGTVVPKGGRGDDANMTPVAALQKGMKSMLGLEFQLDHIDYTQKNFIHADMSPQEFAESRKQNEESVSGYMLKAMGQGMAMQQAGKGPNNVTLLLAMMSRNKEIKMRRAFAQKIEEMEGGMTMFEGKDGSTIIDHRNAKCMEVLQQEIESGKTNLAIFYGAGHLPDMEQRLISDFGMQRGGRRWLKAWNLEIKK